MDKDKKKKTNKSSHSVLRSLKVVALFLLVFIGASVFVKSDMLNAISNPVKGEILPTSTPIPEKEPEIITESEMPADAVTPAQAPTETPKSSAVPTPSAKPKEITPYSGSGTSPKYKRESHHYGVSYTFPDGFNLESTLYIKVVINAQLIYVYRRDAKGNPTSCIRTIIMSSGVDRASNATPLGKYMIFDNNANGAGKGRWIDFKTTFSQYGTRLFYITSLQNNKMTGYFTGYMMHSELYRKTDPTSLIVDEYNTIGYPRSHGCMRMQVKDALWIYQNAHTGSIVEITDGSPNTSLWKKLRPANLVSGTKYDPTDPAGGAANPGYISFPPSIVNKATATPAVTATPVPAPVQTPTPNITEEPVQTSQPTSEPTPESTD